MARKIRAALNDMEVLGSRRGILPTGSPGADMQKRLSNMTADDTAATVVDAWLGLDKQGNRLSVEGREDPVIKLPPGAVYTNRVTGRWVTTYIDQLLVSQEISRQIMYQDVMGEPQKLSKVSLRGVGSNILQSLRAMAKGMYTIGRVGSHVTNFGSNLTLLYNVTGEVPNPITLMSQYNAYQQYAKGQMVPEAFYREAEKRGATRADLEAMAAEFKIYDALSRTEAVSTTVDVEASPGGRTPLGLLFPRIFGEYAPAGNARTANMLLSDVNESMRKWYGQGDQFFKLHLGMHGMRLMVKDFDKLGSAYPNFTVRFDEKTFLSLEKVFNEGGETVARYVDKNGKVVDLNEVQLYDVFARAAQFQGAVSYTHLTLTTTPYV